MATNFKMSERIKKGGLEIQVVLVLLTLTSFYLISFWPVRKFNSLDQQPEIEQVNVAKGKPVKPGFYLRNFLEFEPRSNKFVVDGVMWFECDKSVPNDKLGKFTIGKGDILFQSDPVEQEVGENLKLVRFNVRLSFPSNLDHSQFPFGDHTLFVNVTNRLVSLDDFYFVPNPSGLVVSDSIFTVGWKLVEKKSLVGKNSLVLDKQFPKVIEVPRVIYALDFKDTSSRELWLILIPLLIFFFMSVSVFSLDPVKFYATRTSLISASVGPTITYRYVIQNMTPKVDYAIFSDYIYFMFLILIFLAAMANLFLPEQVKNKPGASVFALYVFLNLGWATLIFWFF